MLKCYSCEILGRLSIWSVTFIAITSILDIPCWTFRLQRVDKPLRIINNAYN